MVRLDRTARDVDCHLLAKLELYNPGFSSKDRPALTMIESAEARRPAPARRHDRRAHERQHRRRARHRRGPPRLQVHLRLPRQGGARQDRPAAGLRRRGDRVPDVGRPRAPRLLLLGVRPAGPRGARARGSPTSTTTPTTRGPSTRRPARRSGSRPRGRITHFVCGVGTGGTITGIGRYLKEQNPAIRTIGADPEGSVYSGGTGRPYLVEGIGEDFWPTTYDPSVVDEVIPISDADELRHRPARHPRGGAAHRRLGRHGDRRRPAGRRRASRPTPWSSSTSPTPAAATCRSSTTTAGWPTTASCAPPAPPSATCSAAATPTLPVARAHPPRRDRARRPSRSCASSR